MLHVISLGAGVQSTTMALMAAHGEIEPMPDRALFADTGWEPQRVYAHLKWLMSPNVLPFPVEIVSNGNIRTALTTDKPGRYAAVPFFLKQNDRGERGMGRRQCTHEYKLKPLMWRQRELLGKGRRQRITPGSCVTWIGISTDEAIRMKPATAAWQTNRWPLIEKRLSRNDCLQWLKRHGYPIPPKSSCIGCPFHGDAHWREMRDNAPEEFADAVRSTATSAPAARSSTSRCEASSTCIQVSSRSIRSISRLPRIMASSTCSTTNAKACVGSDVYLHALRQGISADFQARRQRPGVGDRPHQHQRRLHGAARGVGSADGTDRKAHR